MSLYLSVSGKGCTNVEYQQAIPQTTIFLFFFFFTLNYIYEIFLKYLSHLAVIYFPFSFPINCNSCLLIKGTFVFLLGQLLHVLLIHFIFIVHNFFPQRGWIKYLNWIQLDYSLNISHATSMLTFFCACFFFFTFLSISSKSS